MQIKTMRDAREKNYSARAFGMSGPEGVKVENILKYIEHLGEASQTDVSQWPLEIFMANGKFVTNRSKVNEKFFSYMGTVKKVETKTDVPSIAAPVVEKIKAMISARVEDLIFGAQRGVSAQKSMQIRALNALDAADRNLGDAQLRLNLLRESKRNISGFIEELESVLKAGFYTLKPDQPPNGFSLITKPIALSYFNTKQAQNVFVRMGSYEVHVGLEQHGFNARVFPYDQNPYYSFCRGDAYWHPHVNCSGQICFGNILEEARTNAATLKLKKYLECVQDVIECYSEEGTPYILLGNFERAAQKGALTKNGRVPGERDFNKSPRPAGHFMPVWPSDNSDEWVHLHNDEEEEDPDYDNDDQEEQDHE